MPHRRRALFLPRLQLPHKNLTRQKQNVRLLPYPMKREFLYIILFGVLLSPQAEGVQLKLGDKDIKEAIYYGSHRKELSHPELLKAWRIDLGYGVGSATLITPYASLIILAKESALTSREPTEHEIQKELEEKSGQISFGCGFYWAEKNFSPYF